MSSTDDGIPTRSKHSVLLYCSWVWRPLSSEVTRFNNSLSTVLVTTRDDPTWVNLLERLSTVGISWPGRWSNIWINLSRSLYKLRTKLVRFPCFKSFSVISVGAIYKYKSRKKLPISYDKWLRYICNLPMT